MGQVVIGNRLASNPPYYALYDTGNQRAFSLPLMRDGRVIRVGFWIGRTALFSAVQARFGLYARDGASAAPGTLLGETQNGQLPPWATILYSGRNVEWPLDTPVLVHEGDALATALLVEDEVRVGQFLSTPTPQWREANAGDDFLAPFGTPDESTTPSVDTTTYIVLEENRAPVVVATSHTGQATGDPTPLLTFRVTDPDRTDGYDDYPTGGIIRVWEFVNDQWSYVGAQEFTLSDPGSGTDPIDVAVTWTASLTVGRSYRWTVEVYDQFGGATGTGTAGADSNGNPDGSLAFDLVTTGFVAPTSPVGKQTTLKPGPFTGTYTHPLGTNLKQIQMRILKLNERGEYVEFIVGQVYDIADAASGAGISVNWADNQFELSDQRLAWGHRYAYEWKIIDTSDVESDWMGRAEFWTNFPPQQALILSPSPGTAMLSSPLVTFEVHDDDDDPVATAVSYWPNEDAVNPSFEDDDGTNITVGWTNGTVGTWTRTIFVRDADSWTGNTALGVRVTTAPAGAKADSYIWVANAADFPVVAGARYHFSVQVIMPFAETGKELEAVLVLKWKDSMGASISSITSDPSSGVVDAEDWEELAIEGVAPVGAALAQFELWTRKANTSGWTTANPSIMLWDQVQYERLPDGLAGQVELVGPYEITNPGYDTDLTGWTYENLLSTPNGTASRITTNPYAGAGAARISFAGSSSGLMWRYLCSQFFPATTEDSEYTVRVRVRKNGIAKVTVVPALIFYGSSSVFDAPDRSTPENWYTLDDNGDWTEISITELPADGAESFRIALYGYQTEGLGGAHSIDIDAWEIDNGVQGIFTATPSPNGIFTYQTSLPALSGLPRIYTLRARGLDQNNRGDWSPPTLIVHRAPIVGAIIDPDPDEVLATAQPMVVWEITSGGQERYWLQLFDTDSGELVYDSGWVAGQAIRSHQIPLGFVEAGGSYTASITIDDGFTQVVL